MTEKKPIASMAADDAGGGAGATSDSSGESDAHPDVHGNLTHEKQKRVLEMQMHTLSMHGARPPSHPLADKFNDEHISKILNIAERNNEIARKGRSEFRWLAMLSIVIAVSFLMFLTLFLVGSHTEVYMELIEFIVAFLGGLGGGIGIKSYLDRKG